MKIGLTQITARNEFSFPETLQVCREAGYEAIELLFEEGGDPDIGMSADEIRAVGRACREAGVEIASLLAWYKERGNLISPDPRERARRERETVRALEIAEILGVEVILLHPGRLTPQDRYQVAFDRLVGTLKELAVEAGRRGVVIGLENVWNQFLQSPAEMRALLDEVGSPWVRSYFDVANMRSTGYPEVWIRELGGRIVRVHFKDFSGASFRYVPFGEGEIDWPAVMRELRAIGYDGYVIHELGGDRGRQIELARRMREIIEKGTVTL